MATAASSSAAILSTMKHVTANKWNKAEARLAEIQDYVRDAEGALAYKPGTPNADPQDLEADVAMLLTAVRKSYAGAPTMDVSTRAGLRAKGGKIKSSTHYETLQERLNTIERMLSNAKYSSGFSPSAALSWRTELLAYLRQAERRMEYTILFGKLTNEWANLRFGELSDSIAATKQGDDSAISSDDEGAVSVGRKEMYEQRQVWEGLVTNLRASDKDKIVEFLDDLFQSGPRYKEDDTSVEELADLRTTLLRRMRSSIFHGSKGAIQVNVATVKAAIKAILSADQLNSEKRRAMIDLSGRENVLSEIADILKIDLKLAAIERWSWGDSPIKAQMRKAINGKYRVYMDIELLDSILIQCIGQSVSVQISRALTKAWIPEVASVWKAKKDEDRIAAIKSHIPNFCDQTTLNSVSEMRNDIYQRIFFSPRLPTSMTDGNSGVGRYDDDGSDTDDEQHKSNLTELQYGGAPNVFNLKTDILRVCSADMAVQKIAHGQFCLLQSDFEWFGPSLPHSTLITIMEYFRFPKELVQFTKSFLNMNLKFEEDGADGAVLTRKTGIPVSFQLTDGISELLLFVLDFAVNQRTGGAHLYRNHDDLWFWGQPSQCAVAWETICEFTKVMGMQLNKDKTACAHAVDKSNPRFQPASKDELARLPANEVKWGFLLFDEDNWEWTANKTAIKDHMDELRFQLKTRTSVMSHIQAYNAYIKNFLPNNFGPVVVGLGDGHPVMVLEALQYAQNYLYRRDSGAYSSGSVASHVRKTIQDRFGDDEMGPVPDCFLYLGVEYGGLGLANPAPAFAHFIQLPKNDLEVDQKPLPPMKDALRLFNSEISEAYRNESQQFVTRLNNKRQKLRMQSKPLESDDSETDSGLKEFNNKVDGVPQFMSFSTYMGTALQLSPAMRNLYATLLEEPASARSSVSSQTWAARMFDGELEDMFGGYIGEEEFLSLGLYRTLAEEKVRWSG